MNIVHRGLTDKKVIVHHGSPNIVKSNDFHLSLTHGSMWKPGGLMVEHPLSRRYKYAGSMPGVTQAKYSMTFNLLEDTALPAG
jgi:hypothetical protein